MWSWEFARRCCDVHPLGEFDKQYLQGLQNATASALSVYIKVTDFVPFLTWFLAQPADTRVTVVSGLEDFGPVEIFSPTHARSSIVVAQLCSLQNFLTDERLVAWFAQNYDVGSNPIVPGASLTPSTFSLIPAAAWAKLRPVPLGLDLHTWASKGDMRSRSFQQQVRAQKAQLEGLIRGSAPFLSKRPAVVVSFGCVYKRDSDPRRISRAELCRLLSPLLARNSPLLASVVGRGQDGRTAFWREAAHRAAFVLAPVGAGLDTHRLWEALLLRAVPVVLSSPLDALYGQFPVLIVHDWAQAFNASFLRTQQAALAARWGLDAAGRLGADGLPLLSVQPWVDLVRAAGANATSPLTH